MGNTTNYLFASERLGFRSWKDEDLEIMAELNSSELVMEHFPFCLKRQATKEMLERFSVHFEENGYTYFAAEIIETGELIGFIGIFNQVYKSRFNPSVDIGWRLKVSAWNKGYATEGAKRCLKFAFEEIHLKSIVAVCTVANVNSEKVMQKIGMKKQYVFNHPKLIEYPDYEKCILYTISKNQWEKQV